MLLAAKYAALNKIEVHVKARAATERALAGGAISLLERLRSKSSALLTRPPALTPRADRVARDGDLPPAGGGSACQGAGVTPARAGRGSPKGANDGSAITADSARGCGERLLVVGSGERWRYPAAPTMPRLPWAPPLAAGGREAPAETCAATPQPQAEATRVPGAWISAVTAARMHASAEARATSPHALPPSTDGSRRRPRIRPQRWRTSHVHAGNACVHVSRGNSGEVHTEAGGARGVGLGHAHAAAGSILASGARPVVVRSTRRSSMALGEGVLGGGAQLPDTPTSRTGLRRMHPLQEVFGLHHQEHDSSTDHACMRHAVDSRAGEDAILDVADADELLAELESLDMGTTALHTPTAERPRLDPDLSGLEPGLLGFHIQDLDTLQRKVQHGMRVYLPALPTTAQFSTLALPQISAPTSPASGARQGLSASTRGELAARQQQCLTEGDGRQAHREGPTRAVAAADMVASPRVGWAAAHGGWRRVSAAYGGGAAAFGDIMDEDGGTQRGAAGSLRMQAAAVSVSRGGLRVATSPPSGMVKLRELVRSAKGSEVVRAQQGLLSALAQV